jgi:hypothetical protein
MHLVARFLAPALLLAGCTLSGNVAQDITAIQARIVHACLLSPLFRAAGGAVTIAVPAAVLPVDLVNAGVAIVCANPAFFAAQSATTDDWVLKVLKPYMRQGNP